MLRYSQQVGSQVQIFHNGQWLQGTIVDVGEREGGTAWIVSLPDGSIAWGDPSNVRKLSHLKIAIDKLASIRHCSGMRNKIFEDGDYSLWAEWLVGSAGKPLVEMTAQSPKGSKSWNLTQPTEELPAPYRDAPAKLGRPLAWCGYIIRLPALPAVQKVWDELQEKQDVSPKNIPGLIELSKAMEDYENEQYGYQDKVEKYHESESGIYPGALTKQLEELVNELKQKYPRAAVYLQAQSYTLAANDKKVSAGKKAMQVLSDGGDIEEAKNILKNWVGDYVD